MPIAAKALIEQDGEKHTASVVDISLNGAHIQSSASLEQDSTLSLSIIFDELSPPIKMFAKVVYKDGEDYGMECLEIDIDSMLQLRSMLTLHNSDPETIHQESQALWERNSKTPE